MTCRETTFPHGLGKFDYARIFFGPTITSYNMQANTGRARMNWNQITLMCSFQQNQKMSLLDEARPRKCVYHRDWLKSIL